MREKKWKKEKLTEELQILHRDFCTIVNDSKSKTCHKDFLKYIGEKRSDVKSAIANANRDAKGSGEAAGCHYLEDYGISPWCHLKKDPPFGESESEELETWKYFAQKLIDLEIELSLESVTKKPNSKLIIPPPPRYSAENYPECKRHKCENQENYGISVHALYQRAEKRFKAKPGGGYAYMLSLAGLNYHEDIKKQEMRSPISKIQVEPIDFFARYILELLLESNNTDISKEAECILDAASGINGIELRKIFESDCSPDTSAAKQRVNSLINKFNKDKHGRLLFLLKKDIKNRDYTENIYANMMAELHSRWHRNREYRLNKIPFDYDFICKESTELRAWIDSEDVGLRYAFEVSGINPDCHMSELYLGESEKEIQENASKILKLLEKQIGTMSLNVGSLTGNGKHLDTIIEIPHIAEINKDKYAQCHRFRCKPILPRAGTFYVRCQSIFGSWEKALKSININYEEIKRKDAKRDSEYYLLKLGEIVKNNPGWTVKSIKNSNHSIYRGIYNLERRGLLRFLDKFEGNDVMKAAIFEEQFISSNTIRHQ